MTTETSVPPQNVAPTPQRVVGLLAASAVGVVLAVQSRINGTLGTRLDDALAAAVISFGLGLLILLLGTAFSSSGRRGMRRIATEVRSGAGLRWWHCVGGLSGAYLVFSQGAAAGALGVALFTVGVVAGQVANGLVVDRYGLGPGGPQRMTVPRVLGAVIAVGAVAMAVAAELRGANPSGLVLLPVVAGVLMAWQQAVNGRVQHAAGSTLSASTLNFAVGTVALVVAFAVKAAVAGVPSGFPTEPWLYIGGALGIFVIGGAAALVRYTGVLVLSMGMIAGQLIGALLLDLIVPVPGTRIEVSTLAGIGFTCLAVIVASLPDRPGRRSSDLPR
ncbi:DMT family transporter [Parasphingorhabdus pacifica]